MARTSYKHSAYWYARNYGYTRSDASTFTARYVDHVDARYRLGNRSSRHNPSLAFNPLLLAACVAADIGVAMKRTAETFTDPEERDRIRRELLRDLRIIRRPFYYARENERRRQLAADRRKLHRRTTTAPMPSPEDVLEAWNRRKESKENMIVLGGMLHDLECYVDNCLMFDEDGKVVGRNGGIRGWLKVHLPGLSPKYKTLMRYKAMAIKLRQATETKDPKPTATLLTDEPRHEVIREIFEDFRITFSSLEEALDHRLRSSEILLDRKPVKAPEAIREQRMKALKKARHQNRLRRITKLGAPAVVVRERIRK